MARSCTICGHEDRPAIDQALVSGVANRTIATRYGVSEQAVRRHAADHLPLRLQLAQAAQDATEGDRLLAELVALQRRAMKLLTQAEQAGDLRAAASLIGQARSTLETLAELRGQLDRRPQVNVSIVAHPDFRTFLGVILTALDAHPSARLALTAALEQQEGNRP